jgi:hypothetical protein
MCPREHCGEPQTAKSNVTITDRSLTVAALLGADLCEKNLRGLQTKKGTVVHCGEPQTEIVVHACYEIAPLVAALIEGDARAQFVALPHGRGSLGRRILRGLATQTTRRVRIVIPRLGADAVR